MRFYTKIIFLKNLPLAAEQAKNMIVYEPDHYANDKTYKKCQYRKLIGEDLHQLIFIDHEPDIIASCIGNSNDKSVYSIRLSETEILSISRHELTEKYSPNNYYLYHVRNYLPFNANDNQKLDVQKNNDIILPLLESNLCTHISFISDIIYKGVKPEIEILMYQRDSALMPKKINQHISVTALFSSSLYIPPDFNIGIKAATNGLLTLLT